MARTTPTTAAPATSSTSTSTRSPGKSSTGRGVWAAAVDGINSSVARYADPVGLDTVDLLDGAVELYEALAAGLRRMGSTTLDAVAIDPRVAALYEGLGDGAASAAAAMADAANAVRRAHAERIDRVVTADPKERKWDISVNTGGARRGRR